MSCFLSALTLLTGATSTVLAQPRSAVPADVPIAVRIERPSEDEIAVAKGALAKFLENAEAKRHREFSIDCKMARVMASAHAP